MGKKVKVTTKCGDEHFYDFDQEVESVEIIKPPKVAKGHVLNAKDGTTLMAFWYYNNYSFIKTDSGYDMLDPKGEKIGYVYECHVGGIYYCKFAV